MSQTAGGLIIVLIRPFPIFPAVPLRIDHAFKKDTGSVLGVAGAFVQGLLDGEAGVKSDAIEMMSV